LSDFFTYATLGTLAGTITATTLIVQYIKDLKPFKQIPTRLLVLIVSFTIILITSLIKKQFSIKNIPLYLINSLLAATSAIGSWHSITDIKNGKQTY